MAALPVFDAHLHVINPRFPLVPSQGFVPEAYTAASYLARATPLGVVGGAVVSGSFQGFDQAYLEDALSRLGDGFVGVTQLPADVDDAEVVRLDGLGVRAVRFNLVRGGSAEVSALEPLASRVHALVGWHAELYVDGRELPALSPRLRRLPRVVIDHLGLRAAGLDALEGLIGDGAYVKATGFGRVDFDVRSALVRLAARGSERVMFGTDLPSTRAPRPFEVSDLTLVKETFGEVVAAKVLHGNAVALYRPRSAQ